MKIPCQEVLGLFPMFEIIVYRRVMLPMIVLRRLDCVLEENHDKVAKKYEQFKKEGKLSEDAIHIILGKPPPVKEHTLC